MALMPSQHDNTLLQPLSRAMREELVKTLKPAEQLSLIRTDQRREWLADRRVLIEAYLARFPSLTGDTSAVVELLWSEFQLRTELGDRPNPDEYERRFPDFADALRRRLQAGDVVNQAAVAETLISEKPGLDSNFATMALPPAAALEQMAPTLDKDETAPDDKPGVRPIRPTRPYQRPIAGMPVIPGYEVLGELGRGGMGVVYRARQKALGREVALKMVLSGQFAGAYELERFRTEAMQMAKLQHANIVQIYEIGEFDGRPYLALEYLPGGSLAKVLESKPLGPMPAAELVETLSRAAHHAHERGIIHRDLKPANVLLGADGSPKITDFGLAKGGGSVSDTASYAVLGTPSYMAPEQAGGQSRDVGPTADVYALGSILYESLTGRPPFRAATALDTMQLVTSTEPVPPSELTINLPRDIETITLKCLQKDPAKRYQTAADLADDLQRFRTDRPIRARPTPTWEKVWKWAKRRPAWAGLIATLIIATTSLIGIGIWVNAVVRHERDIAREQRDRARTNAELAERRFQENREAVDRYFTGVSESELQDEPGLQPLRKKLLKIAQGYYAKFVSERGDDPSVRTDLAKSLTRLARITSELDDPREAIQLHLQALRIYDELVQKQPDDLGARFQVAETWYELSKLYRITDQTTDAESAGTTAIGLWDRLVQEFPGDPKYREELARSLLSQGTLYLKMARLGPARAACEQSLAIRQKLVEEQPKSAALRRDIATTWGNLANLQAVARDWTASAQSQAKARDLLVSLVSEHPFRSLYRNDLARTEFNLGSMLLQTGQAQPAIEALREAVNQWDRLHYLFPSFRDYQSNLANALFALSQAQWRLGLQGDADANLAKAHTQRAELVQLYPGVPELSAELARCDAEAGDRLMKRGQPAAATVAFRKAVEQLDHLATQNPGVPRYRVDLARQTLNLGQSLSMAGHVATARETIGRSIALWEALKAIPTVAGDAQIEFLHSLVEAGDVERRATAPEKALAWYDRCLSEGEALGKQLKNPVAVRIQLRNACWGKAEALTALGRYPEALAAWDSALSFDDGSQQTWLKIHRLVTMARTSDYEKALEELDTLAGEARVSGPALWEVARVYSIAARSAATDMRQPKEERDRRANAAGERAVDHLQLARTKGFFADPAMKLALEKHPDFDATRSRPDFQKLLAGLAKQP